MNWSETADRFCCKKVHLLYHEKAFTCIIDFQSVLAQTEAYSHRRLGVGMR